MTRLRKRALVLSAGVLAAAFVLRISAKAASRRPPLAVAPSVDLKRYAGKWYEIARLPNWFQRSCAREVTATYTLRPDGKITVVNECSTADGRRKSVKGTAKVAGASGPNTKLKVTFFWPFSGDYWIVDLDPDYRWALIGEPERKYLWILGREPSLDHATLERLLARAREQGYDVAPLIRN